MSYSQVYESSSGGWVWQHELHSDEELLENLEAARILADHGYKIELLPVIPETNQLLRAELLHDVFGDKNPDIRINNQQIGDIKTPVLPTQKAINRAIYRSGQQMVEIAVVNLANKDYAVSDLKKGIIGAMQPGRNKSIQETWIITKNKGLFRVTRDIVFDDTIYNFLNQL